MTFVNKPLDGYHTPYQVLVDGFSNYVLTQLNEDSSNGNFNQLQEKWSGLSETECDITVPVWNDVKQRWYVNIKSNDRDLRNELPLSFFTITIKHFLDNVLRTVKRQSTLGKGIKEPGFYYTKDSQQVVIILDSNFDFKSPILFEGWQFDPEMYRLSEDNQTLIIDSPVVAGDVPIIYVDVT